MAIVPVKTSIGCLEFGRQCSFEQVSGVKHTSLRNIYLFTAVTNASRIDVPDNEKPCMDSSDIFKSNFSRPQRWDVNYKFGLLGAVNANIFRSLGQRKLQPPSLPPPQATQAFKLLHTLLLRVPYLLLIVQK